MFLAMPHAYNRRAFGSVVRYAFEPTHDDSLRLLALYCALVELELALKDHDANLRSKSHDVCRMLQDLGIDASLVDQLGNALQALWCVHKNNEVVPVDAKQYPQPPLPVPRERLSREVHDPSARGCPRCPARHQAGAGEQGNCTMKTASMFLDDLEHKKDSGLSFRCLFRFPYVQVAVFHPFFDELEDIDERESELCSRCATSPCTADTWSTCSSTPCATAPRSEPNPRAPA